MRTTVTLVACWLTGCGGGGGGSSVTPGIDAALDAAKPLWWQPTNDGASNWDIQLSAPIDLSTPRVMYDLDLWAVVPAATTIDYGDGAPVAVPAGALPTAIAQLHATTPPTIVICHVETGVLDLSLPDAPKFPGYQTSDLPVSPTPPATGSAIGWPVGTSAKRWLDITAAGRGAWIPIMFKRFDLAKQIGCDGVEPDRNLAAEFASSTGFPITATDSYSWFAELATQGHARLLSTGMKNGNGLGGQPDMEVTKFDWMMIERCGDSDTLNCDTARPFINAGKAVFGIEYNTDSSGVAQDSASVCAQEVLEMLNEGIYKDVALTSRVRVPCVP